MAIGIATTTLELGCAHMTITQKELLVGVMIVACTGLIITIAGQGTISQPVQSMTAPLSQAAANLGRQLRSLSTPLIRGFQQQQTADALSQQLSSTQASIVEIEQLQAENAQLRELLENRHLTYKPRRVARPIVSSLAPLVWLGEQSDVKEGWQVLYKNTLLGRVTRVDGQYARVGLLSGDDGLSVLVQTAGGVKGLTQSSNGRVVVTNVAPEALIVVGERITTVGQPGVSPGKLVGVISAIERDEKTAAQQLVIDQLVSFYRTSIVELEE